MNEEQVNAAIEEAINKKGQTEEEEKEFSLSLGANHINASV